MISVVKLIVVIKHAHSVPEKMCRPEEEETLLQCRHLEDSSDN